MTRISDGSQFTAVSGADGYAYVNGPVLPYDEFYNSTVTKEGYQTYSLTNANWGDGGFWIARLIPTEGSTVLGKVGAVVASLGLVGMIFDSARAK